MADGFIAGQAKAADDVASGADEAFLGGGGQEGPGVQLLAASSQLLASFCENGLVSFSAFHSRAEGWEKMAAFKSLSNEEPQVGNEGSVSF